MSWAGGARGRASRGTGATVTQEAIQVPESLAGHRREARLWGVWRGAAGGGAGVRGARVARLDGLPHRWPATRRIRSCGAWRAVQVPRDAPLAAEGGGRHACSGGRNVDLGESQTCRLVDLG